MSSSGCQSHGVLSGAADDAMATWAATARLGFGSWGHAVELDEANAMLMILFASLGRVSGSQAYTSVTRCEACRA